VEGGELTACGDILLLMKEGVEKVSITWCHKISSAGWATFVNVSSALFPKLTELSIHSQQSRDVDLNVALVKNLRKQPSFRVLHVKVNEHNSMTIQIKSEESETTKDPSPCEPSSFDMVSGLLPQTE
jgi:hypothetical protein